jgi:hypothetical protein
MAAMDLHMHLHDDIASLNGRLRRSRYGQLALIVIKVPCRFCLPRNADTRPEISPGSPELAVALEPSDDLWPHARMRFSPHENAKMLQTDPHLTLVFNDPRVHDR